MCVLAFRSACAASLPFEDLADVRGPYDGTGARGEALYICKLGDAGGWPICAYWSSARTERSPFLGMGWSIPALESRFVPLDERRWAFHQPDGYVRVFVKPQRGDGKTLYGGLAWTAKVDGDSVRIVADPKDGGVKSEFSFRQGRLVRMACEEGDFEIRYAGRVPERIISRGKTMLEIVRETSPVPRIDFRFNGGKAHAWAKCQECRVFGERGDSYAVLSSQENCLVELERSSGEKTAFSYGGENGDAFFTAGEERWVWDPNSRRIGSCGDWKYTIEDPEPVWNEPGFARSDSVGHEEYYHYDRKTGVRTERYADGSERTCKVFTSGPLEGQRLRWMKKKTESGVFISANFAYDEMGRLVYRRAERADPGQDSDKIETWYDHSGAIIRRRVNGKEVSAK